MNLFKFIILKNKNKGEKISITTKEYFKRGFIGIHNSKRIYNKGEKQKR